MLHQLLPTQYNWGAIFFSSRDARPRKIEEKGGAPRNLPGALGKMSEKMSTPGILKALHAPAQNDEGCLMIMRKEGVNSFLLAFLFSTT